MPKYKQITVFTKEVDTFYDCDMIIFAYFYFSIFIIHRVIPFRQTINCVGIMLL